MFGRGKLRNPAKPLHTQPWFMFESTAPAATAGAMNMALVSEWLAWHPMIGPAIGARQQFSSIFPTPQAYQAVQAGWLSGLNGVQHGQSVLQPLSNPYE